MKYLSLFALLFLLACKSSTEYSTESITCLKPSINESQHISRLLKHIKYIRLETVDDALIGNHIGKIKKINDKYFISSDRKDLFVFDNNGLFIKQIGRLGNGPGEYSLLADYDVFENEDILIASNNKLILYDKEGVYQKSISLNLNIFNIKIINNENILLYSSGEKYVIYEIDLSGKVIKQTHKATQATRLAKNIAFVRYGQTKYLTQTGRSNDFIVYNDTCYEFSYTKLLCDDILSAIQEDDLINDYGLKYLETNPNLEFIDGISGCESHFLFAVGSANGDFSAQVLNINSQQIEYVISKKDVDDVTFTSPFFMQYACLSDAQDCFITYVYPANIRRGLEVYDNYRENSTYQLLKEMYSGSEKDIEEENPTLIEFLFK